MLFLKLITSVLEVRIVILKEHRLRSIIVASVVVALTVVAVEPSSGPFQ